MKRSAQEPTPDKSAEYLLDGFVLRTPLLPTASFISLPEQGGAKEWASKEGFSRGCSAIRERMRLLISMPEVAEALFIASPSLSSCIPVWLDKPNSERGRRVERSLVKYLARMSARPTPFGLFSGCSVGRLGDETRLTLEARGRYGRHSRLDMDYLFSLTETLNRDPEFRHKLLYRPNDTMVRLGGRIRYVEPRVGTNNARQYHWVAVEATPYLEHVLARSGRGATISDLVAALVEHDSEIAADEALTYVGELIDAHVLVSTLQPAVTGSEPAGELALQLRTLGEGRSAACLERIVSELARLDASGLGQPSSAYLSMVDLLKALPAPVEVSRLVQVDMIKPAELALGPKVRAEIVRCAEMVAQFASPSDRLASFRTAFDKRYGTAAVPLLWVLDPEAGIGLGDAASTDESPLLAGLPLARRETDESIPWRARHGWLLNKLHQAWQQGDTELVLEDADLEALFGKKETQATVAAFSVGFTLIAESPAAIDRGEFRLMLRGVGGPSGARMLSRFAHVDSNIDAVVRKHLREEEAQAQDVVFAEIAHLPQGRLGNIILRPVLRNCELIYMGRSGAPEEQQMPLSDLLVTVRGNSILLWSSRSGKRIVPRLTNAHNFSHPSTLAPYRFLGLMQTEGLRSGFSWDWGPLSSAPYLPRLRWGRIVLSRATWRISEAEIASLAKGDACDRFRATRAWAERRRVPRLVELVDGDNELLVDLDNPLSVDAFIELTKDRPSATLAEMLPSPSDLCVASSEGTFMHEVYVPIVRKVNPAATAIDAARLRPSSEDPRPLVPAAIRRSIAPGAEWLFVKIYTGGSEADRILPTIVKPLVSEVMGAALAERWFFIRYSDPEYHLRLRFRGDPRVLHGEVLPRLQQSLASWLEAGNVSRVLLDTYQPEIERYGGPIGLDLSEQVFQADSEAVIELLAQLEGDAGAEARWQLALRGLESLIDDFGFDAQEKRAIVARRRREYGLEFKADSSGLKHKLGERFRSYRKTLMPLLDRSRDAADDLAVGLETLKRRSEKLKHLAARLRAAESRNELSTPLHTLIDSYLHMYVNRISRAEGKAHELVMFDFLNRHYESLQARARKATQPA